MKKLPIFRKILDNGLDTIIIKNGYIPNISINLTYKVGSQDEQVGTRGFAHLFEHLMFEGSKNLPKGEFDKLCSLAGGNNNAYTTYDWTSYIMTLPSTQLELGIWMEAERMFNFDIQPESLKNQQNVVTEEIRQVVENQPYGKWRDLLASTAFNEKSSYSWEVHGKIEDVQNADMNTVRDFRNKFYSPNNASLVIIGDIDKDKAFDLIEKHFSAKTNSTETPRNIFQDSFKNGGVIAQDNDNVPDEALFMAFHYPGMRNEEYLVGDVTANILGQGKSSLLNNKLVYNDEIASFAGAFPDSREHTSLFTTYAIASSSEVNSERLLNAINEQINKLKTGDFDNDTLLKTSNQIKTNLANQLMMSSGLADNVGKMAMLYDEPERVYNMIEKYDKIGKDEIIEFANMYLNENNLVQVRVLPK